MGGRLPLQSNYSIGFVSGKESVPRLSYHFLLLLDLFVLVHTSWDRSNRAVTRIVLYYWRLYYFATHTHISNIYIYIYIALLTNTPAQVESLLYCLEQAASGIDLYVNADKTEYMYFNQSGNSSTLNGGSLKLVDKFTFIESSISSTENYINTWLAKPRTAIDKLSVIWNSDQSNKIKHNFFQAAVVSLLYGCTTWTLIKRIVKKLEDNCTKMPRAILNKSWKHITQNNKLYGYLTPISKIIQTNKTWGILLEK